MKRKVVGLSWLVLLSAVAHCSTAPGFEPAPTANETSADKESGSPESSDARGDAGARRKDAGKADAAKGGDAAVEGGAASSGGGAVGAQLLSAAFNKPNFCVRVGSGWKCGLEGASVDSALADAEQVVSGYADAISCKRAQTTGAVSCGDGDSRTPSFGCFGAFCPDAAVPRTYVPTGLTGASAIALGDQALCAVQPSGVACVRLSFSLGLGALQVSAGSVTPVPSTGGALDVAVGGHFGCALFANGELRCWRKSLYEADVTAAPQPVAGLAPVRKVVASRAGVCVLLVGGGVECFRMRYQPNVSPGVPIGFSPPVRVVDDAVDLDMASIGERATIGSVGGGGGAGSGSGGASGSAPEHATKAEACAALQDGTVKCWSDGIYKSSGGPITVQGISSATHVAVGEFYGMARLATGAVVSFSNFYGQAALPVPSIP